MKNLRKRSSVGSEPSFLQDEEILPALLQCIRDAKKILRIALRDVLNSTRFELEIEQAVKRGVDVRLLLPLAPDLDAAGIAERLGTVRTLLQRGVTLQVVPELQSELVFTENSVLLLTTPLSSLDQDPRKALAFEFDAERHATNYLKFRAFIEDLEESAMHIAELPAFATNVGREGVVGLIATTAVPRSERKRNPLARKAAMKRKRQGAHQPKPNAPDEEPGCCIQCALDIVFNENKPLCRDCFEDWAALPIDEREGRYCHSCGEIDVTSEESPFCFECESGA